MAPRQAARSGLKGKGSPGAAGRRARRESRGRRPPDQAAAARKNGGAPEERRRLPAAGFAYCEGAGLQVPSQTAPKLPMTASHSFPSQAAALSRQVPAVSRPAPAGP